MTDGATNPPITPSELIAAIPPAEAAPDKKQPVSTKREA